MKLEVSVNSVPDWIEVLAPAPDCRFRVGDGGDREAEIQSLEPGVYSILMDGRCYEAHIEERAGVMIVSLDGFRFEIEVRDPRRLARRAGDSGRDGVEVIVAPMPGKVVRVLVAQGDAVEAGQGVVVVEAMKMQNEMKAGRAGRVAAVSVKEGATVAAGETLVRIE